MLWIQARAAGTSASCKNARSADEQLVNTKFSLITWECPDIYIILFIEYEPNQLTLQTTLTNDTCYWSVSGNRNWTEAETECDTEGGHLVEIFNEATQNIIVSLIATEQEYLDELYWIGIEEYENSSSQWRSGASIIFSNFPLNTTTDLDSGCVAIDKYGIWIISDCENKYSFVCGKSKFNLLNNYLLLLVH